ncbi:hypothetical protein [Labrys wisconsinensis]|uniref:Uncharacterized protein n=1 Tax=Labrys wisconsinensis TaxID=425677 RepID=A0ABU0JBF5_9HYPH|nr:hypothetical protein [Labrys wisconsinensis]MDQ0471606.1 hypothetical protein [Labrys wisconsinensis]
MLSRLVISAALLAAAVPALAADLPMRDDAANPAMGGAGEGYGDRRPGWRRAGTWSEVEIDCYAEWRRLNPPGAPIRATNSLCDPSYIGSGYGLARPSYYGTLPRLGHTAYGWSGPEGP